MTKSDDAVEQAKCEGGLGDKSMQHAWMAYADANNVPHDHEDEEPFKWGFNAGAGAASIDRVAVVREAFERVKEILPSISLGDFEEDDYPKAMDAVIEEMEKGNGRT